MRNCTGKKLGKSDRLLAEAIFIFDTNTASDLDVDRAEAESKT